MTNTNVIDTRRRYVIIQHLNRKISPHVEGHCAKIILRLNKNGVTFRLI